MKKWLNGLAICSVAAIALGCASTGQTVHTKEKAVMGGLLGAAAGGIIGHQSGRGLEGAAVGAAAGSVAGGVMGSAQDERETMGTSY